MDTRSQLKDSGAKCSYCQSVADTNDHAPPKCLLRRPLPSNLITLPACTTCNNKLSPHEEVVRCLLALLCFDPELIAEREAGYRAIARNGRLTSLFTDSRQADGNYALTRELTISLEVVLCKVGRGLYFGLYGMLVGNQDCRLSRIEDSRTMSPEDLAEQLRPPPLQDITDDPLPDLTMSSWPLREPVVIITLTNAEGINVEKVFRAVRQTPIKWIEVQPKVFKYTFIEHYQIGVACIMELWGVLAAAVTLPWPSSRGPIRRGKKNVLSRDRS